MLTEADKANVKEHSEYQTSIEELARNSRVQLTPDSIVFKTYQLTEATFLRCYNGHAICTLDGVPGEWLLPLEIITDRITREQIMDSEGDVYDMTTWTPFVHQDKTTKGRLRLSFNGGDGVQSLAS